MIQLHRLEGFYWVARTGGYSSAARAFPYAITQPAVHQQVKKLETELGLALFERVGKDRMLLTAAGRALFDFCGPFFEGLPTVVRALKAGTIDGELRILAQGLMLRHLMPGWLSRLRKKKPGARIDLRELRQADATPLLRGDADLLVGHLPKVPADVATMRIGTLHPFLVMSRKHRLASRKRVRLSDFSGETFIGYNPGHLAHRLQIAVLEEHAVEPRDTISAGTADAILGFVEAGLGFSLVPLLDPAGPRGRAFVARPLNLAAHRYPVEAMWRKGHAREPAPRRGARDRAARVAMHAISGRLARVGPDQQRAPTLRCAEQQVEL